ncbi:hypothetical protein DFH07DRAFT_726048, partial [Mycena maculata]
FEGSGSDGVGPFNLQGYVDLESGSLEAEKKYVNFQWKWSGSITAFGLLGRWRSDSVRISRWGGWWWIWPAQWN